MKAILIAIFSYSALATPDCYDFSVTKIIRDYMEIVPMFLYYNQVDWIVIQGGASCGFYTYGDVFYKSYSDKLQGVYFRFYKGNDLQCNLNNNIVTFKNESWIYSNSIPANQELCGYYVGVANSGTEPAKFTIIRTSAILLKMSVSIIAAVSAIILLN
ncbi:UNKNOWN [Stylonychia lemnae]|uniref:Uncharacterized protein n=1 Tax=Stylonychia lemnae TaxID=5949 RepID=A0A077ZN91_STYLE|nr:UNKNOWN [Stylonychia lemnae]|eukprot:CDW71452.1 UNKNOWN [Stylonychia lemnae]